MSASVLIEAVEAEGFGRGGVVAAAFGDVQVAGVFEGVMMVARMVARLTGPLPVRLAEASSPKVTSRMFSGGRAWSAEVDLRVVAGQQLVVMKLPGATGVVQ
jgi:hypothetical protein